MESGFKFGFPGSVFLRPRAFPRGIRRFFVTGKFVTRYEKTKENKNSFRSNFSHIDPKQTGL
jgi:hypothetical protein